MSLPAGMIIIWSGAIGNIPAGWLLCNGVGGTPDLRDRFIVGAGSTYDPDDTGGAANHNHDFTGDGHSHTIGGSPVIAAGANIGNTVSSTQVTGTTDNESSLPPFYALAFIMKI